MKNIYDLELHETEEIGMAFFVTRVAGGFLYKQYNDNGRGGHTCSMSFVPISYEFATPEQIAKVKNVEVKS